jgi:hypothetical protein
MKTGISMLAMHLLKIAPDLWNILGLLLSSDQRSQRWNNPGPDGDQILVDSVAGDDGLWEGLLEITMADDGETVDENRTFIQLDPHKKAAWRDAICTIVCHWYHL